MVHRWHVDQEAPGQSDMAGDACAFLADGLLGNLNQNLLSFFQQVADQRDGRRFAASETTSSSSTTTAATITTSAFVPWTLKARTLRPLGVSSGRGWGSNLGPGIDRAVAPSLRIEQRLGLGLRFLQLYFLAVFFTFRRSRLRRVLHARLCQRGHVDFRHCLASVAVQLVSSSRFLFKLLVALIGRRLVMNRVRLFLVDRLLLHCSRSGKNGSLFLAG